MDSTTSTVPHTKYKHELHTYFRTAMVGRIDPPWAMT